MRRRSAERVVRRMTNRLTRRCRAARTLIAMLLTPASVRRAEARPPYLIPCGLALRQFKGHAVVG
jgi:hypothetical protein